MGLAVVLVSRGRYEARSFETSFLMLFSRAEASHSNSYDLKPKPFQQVKALAAQAHFRDPLQTSYNATRWSLFGEREYEWTRARVASLGVRKGGPRGLQLSHPEWSDNPKRGRAAA